MPTSTSTEFRPPDISDARRWGVVGLLFAASLINYLDRATLSYALPSLSDDLHLDPLQKGYLGSAFFWSYAYMQIPIGWVCDRFHLKWVYAGLFAIWSLACGLVGLAGSLGVLIGLRILLGLGESIYLPGGMKVVSVLFPPNQRGFPSGLFDFGTRAGLVLGGILIPALTVRYGWRAMFMVVGFFALLWLPPWLLTYPGKSFQTGSANPNSRAADGRESYVVLLYPILLLLSPIWFLLDYLTGNRLPRSSDSPTWGPLLRFIDLLRNRNLIGIVFGFFCFDYYWYVLLIWLPDYLVKGRGMTIERAGYLAAIAFFIFGIAEPIGGWLADHLIKRGWSETRTRKGIVTIGWLSGLLLIPAGFVKSDSTALVCIYVACFVGFSTGNLLAILQCCAPPDKVGTWTGVKNYSGNLGGIGAPLVMGYLLKQTGSYGYGFAVGAIILILGLIPYWFVVQELRPPGDKITHP